MKLNVHTHIRRLPPLLVATLCVAFPALGAEPASANYSIRGGQFSSGVGSAASPDYQLGASVEPLLAGTSSSADYENTLGSQPRLNDEAGNLIVNGSFENVAATFVSDGTGVMSLPAGSSVIPGWTTSLAESIWGGNFSIYTPRTIYGDYAVDLTGYHDTLPYAAVSQTIATTPDQTYRLTFAIGTFEDDNRYNGPVTVRATTGSLVGDHTFAPAGTGNQWGSFSQDFVATDASTLIQLEGVAATGGSLLFIDNVAVVVTVPPLEITRLEFAGNDLILNWRTQPGRNYEVQSRNNFELSAWEPVPGSSQTATGPTMQFTVPNAAGQDRRFYQIIRPANPQ